jgi:ESCRT-I complex subunit TSG101
MSSLDLTRDWLRNVLKPYPSRERMLPEIMEILARRRTLSVKTEAFSKSLWNCVPQRAPADVIAFDNGQAALLVLLYGTLPINFKGATYHIPVHIWIPHEYPRMPPLAFVVPTKDMGVRKGREVEPSGRVTEAVVQTWWNGWEVSRPNGQGHGRDLADSESGQNNRDATGSAHQHLLGDSSGLRQTT